MIRTETSFDEILKEKTRTGYVFRNGRFILVGAPEQEPKSREEQKRRLKTWREGWKRR